MFWLLISLMYSGCLPMWNNLVSWFNALSLKEGTLLLFWVILAIVMVYSYGQNKYQKGHKDGYSRGVRVGKVIASERYID